MVVNGPHDVFMRPVAIGDAIVVAHPYMSGILIADITKINPKSVGWEAIDSSGRVVSSRSKFKFIYKVE